VDLSFTRVLNINLHSRFLDASNFSPSKDEPMFYSLLLFVHLSMDGKKYISSTLHILPKCSLNAIRNMVYLSKMMLHGILECTQTFLKNIIAAYCPLMVFLQGTRMHILLNMSSITNRCSCPLLVLGKPLMKSMNMLSHGLVAIGKGWNRPCFLLLGLLVHQSMRPPRN
jgi:hypothetical protein